MSDLEHARPPWTKGECPGSSDPVLGVLARCCQRPGPRLTFGLCAHVVQGSLSTYRFCDEVWTFLIKNVQFKLDNGGQTVMADKVKIVSCNAKKPGEGP